MDQLGLEGLLGRYDKNGLSGSSREPAEEVILLIFGSEDVRLHVCIHAKTDLVLRNGEHQQGTISAVEAKDAALRILAFDCLNHALFVEFGVQLHDSLCVLSWVRACNLYRTCNSAYKYRVYNAI